MILSFPVESEVTKISRDFLELSLLHDFYFFLLYCFEKSLVWFVWRSCDFM